MIPIWYGLVANLAVVMLFISAWVHGQTWLEGRPRRIRRFAFAVWMGLGTIASMSLPVHASDGVFFDLRSTLIAVSGFLGGPIGGLITGTIAASYRAALGGPGMWPGLALIAGSVLAGSSAHYLTGYGAPRNWMIILVGIAAGAVTFAGISMLGPESVPGGTVAVAVPVSLLNCCATIGSIWAVVRAGILRNERHLLRAAIAEAPDFFYVKDRDSRFVAVNGRVAAQHGFAAPREMLGKTDYDIVALERARELIAVERDLMAFNSDLIDHEEHFIGADGEDRWFVTSKSPIHGAEGDTVGLVGVTRDVTERRRLETELVQSRDLFSRALVEMSDGLAMFDADGRLVFCNERYRTSFPLTGPMRVPGVHIRDVLQEVRRTGEQVGTPTEDGAAWVQAVIDSKPAVKRKWRSTMANGFISAAGRRTTARPW